MRQADSNGSMSRTPTRLLMMQTEVLPGFEGWILGVL